MSVVLRSLLIILLAVTYAAVSRGQESLGSVRGVISDKDFNAPLGGAVVQILETGQTAKSSDQGNYVIPDVVPGTYSVVVKKSGFVQSLKSGVVVAAGRLTDVDLALAGEFVEMEEVVVDDGLVLDTNTEAGLLNLRLDSPALMDAISADLMSRAGASDAAGALRLVAGATVQDGKSAVIRGLPDRYVSSQLNGVRLPTADEDKRAVELDQFPTAVIAAIQVAKTFTPDQQGDASGGAVNVRLRGIPAEPFFLRFQSQASFNSQVFGENDFLTYKGGGVSFFGRDDGDRDIQEDNIGGNWDGAVGVMTDDAPFDSKWTLSGGGRHEIDEDFSIGGFASLFYERDSSFYDNGKDDSYWVRSPGAAMTPEFSQGAPEQEEFKTSLFDVTQGKKSVQLTALTVLGLEFKEQSLTFAYLGSRTTEDSATLAEDTRGKEFFYPGYDPTDPTSPGYDLRDAAPYLRLETLNYTERTTESFQFQGLHKIPLYGPEIENFLVFGQPEIDWSIAFSSATSNQPDKRQFGSIWFPERIVGTTVLPANYQPFKPSANFNLGNLQRIFKEIEEESDQYALNIKFPFAQWTMDEGYFKFGWFHDTVERTFDQETFSNFNDNSSYDSPFEQFWSAAFPSENHPITESEFDIDYVGELKVTALYGMASVPLTSWFTLIGGVRYETTDISITNDPEPLATWVPPGEIAPTQLSPGDGDAVFEQEDFLPAISFELKPIDEVSIRAAYSETVARPTFKELSPIQQQEFLGGPIFIGNPLLGMSALKNYDLRVDYTPFPGSLISGSYFWKDIKNPIEYVQRPSTFGSFNFTTALNYPEGKLSGFEFEIRQDLVHLSDALDGLSIGANATFIDSEVSLPEDEIAGFNSPNIMAPIETRDMTNAPENLFNFFISYDLKATGTQFTIFYTIQGDTLVAGAGEADSNFVPSLYATKFDTLNLSITQTLCDEVKLQFQAKNLTNPELETVYRSKYIDGDVQRSTYTAGVEFSLALTAEFRF